MAHWLGISSTPSAVPGRSTTGGNYRVITNLGTQLLTAAIWREVRQLDYKLFLELFAAPPRPEPANQPTTRPRYCDEASPNQRRQTPAHPDFVDELEPMSDETATVIPQLLSDLHLQFEKRFLGQIRRHHDAIRPPPKYPDQPWLTARLKLDESSGNRFTTGVRLITAVVYLGHIVQQRVAGGGVHRRHAELLQIGVIVVAVAPLR